MITVRSPWWEFTDEGAMALELMVQREIAKRIFWIALSQGYATKKEAK